MPRYTAFHAPADSAEFTIHDAYAALVTDAERNRQIVTDLGYYPFGSEFFSDLVHYVRTGDFVRCLIRQSRDVNGDWAERRFLPASLRARTPALASACAPYREAIELGLFHGRNAMAEVAGSSGHRRFHRCGYPSIQPCGRNAL